MVGRIAAPGRRKRVRPEGDWPARATVVALKGAPRWEEWLDEFAARCRRGLADSIEQPLPSYAEERGFREPPKR